MFRKGGNVGTGIMTGIVDRSMHAENPLVRPQREQSSFIEEIQQGVGPYGGMDPVTSYLLAAGPQIAKSTSFADLISNLEDPNKMLMQQAADKAKFDRSIRMEGVKRKLDYDALRDQDQLDYGKLIEGRTYDEGQLEKKQAYEDKKYKEYRDDERMYGKEVADKKHRQRMEEVKAKIQGEKTIAQMRLDATKANDPFSEQNQAIEYFKLYGTENEAKNRANFEKNIKVPMMKKFGSNFGGLVGGTTAYSDGSIEAKMKKKGNIGKAFYDVNDGKIKKIDYKLDKNGKKVLGIIIVDDITTYDPSAKKDSATAVKKGKGISDEEYKRIKDAYGFYLPEVIDKIKEKDKEIPFGGTGA
tara:strand:- start:519 stop:1586 length:1068 start_codon:yes stop_codon:yes gene_type:complete